MAGHGFWRRRPINCKGSSRFFKRRLRLAPSWMFARLALFLQHSRGARAREHCLGRVLERLDTISVCVYRLGLASRFPAMAMKRPAAKAGARKRPAAAVAPLRGADGRNRLCAGEGCKFHPLRVGQRAEVLRGKGFDRCIVCGPAVFRDAAAAGQGGGVVARFLNKLAKLDLGIFEEAIAKLKAEHSEEVVQKYETQARRKAERPGVGGEAAAAGNARNRLCAGEGCKFSPLRLGQRAEVPQGTDFRHCVVCGADSFREAAKGRGAARFLNKLAKLDLGIFEEAVAKLEAQHPVDQVEWFVAQARRKARAPLRRELATDWGQLLQWRQRGFRRTAAQKAAFARASKNAKARLARKFPSVYGLNARPQSAWASQRAQRFREWCLQKSWRMCGQCGRMVPQVYKAQHAAGRDRAPAELAACKHCQTEGRQGYWAPLPQDQPKRLRKLPPQVLEALRPLRIHAGPEQRAPRGYAVHGDMLRFSFKAESVREQIAQLPEKERRKAKKARKRLLKNADSAYGEFLDLHEKFLWQWRRAIERGEAAPGEPIKRLPANFIETPGLENCLWPHLYWTRAMCETMARSQDARRLRRAALGGDSEEEGLGEAAELAAEGSRQSAKASFLAKVHSSLIGYSEEPLLLHFVWDLWMWSGIGGARNASGLKIREALASKPYNPEIWKANHMALWWTFRNNLAGPRSS